MVKHIQKYGFKNFQIEFNGGPLLQLDIAGIKRYSICLEVKK